jgi:sugar lactone lactonase YvrE
MERDCCRWARQCLRQRPRYCPHRIDTEGAVRYADVPNKHFARVREGGELLDTIQLDRGCLACMLGGAERKTLFIVAAEWLGFARMAEALATETGQLLAVEVSVLGAWWP